MAWRSAFRDNLLFLFSHLIRRFNVSSFLITKKNKKTGASSFLLLAFKLKMGKKNCDWRRSCYVTTNSTTTTKNNNNIKKASVLKRIPKDIQQISQEYVCSVCKVLFFSHLFCFMIELALHAWFYSLVFALNCTLRICNKM